MEYTWVGIGFWSAREGWGGAGVTGLGWFVLRSFGLLDSELCACRFGCEGFMVYFELQSV